MPPIDEGVNSPSFDLKSQNDKDNSGYEQIMYLVNNNIEFFKDEESPTTSKYLPLLTELKDNIETIQNHIENLNKIAHLFDFDKDTPGNGYRSYLKILNVYIQSTMNLCKTLCTTRNSLLFRADHYYLELKAHVNVISSLTLGLMYLIKMLARYNKGELFSLDDHFSAEELLKEYGNLNQVGFYGRCNGFYYYPSMRKALQGVSVIMASFSDLYQQPGGALSHAAASLLSGGKYALDPELRAKQIVEVAQNASVEFIKAFWGLTESHLIKQMPSWVCCNLAVAETIFVPCANVTVPKRLGFPEDEEDKSSFPTEVAIPAPGKTPIRCRLLSYTRRQGQPGTKVGGKYAEPSNGLIIHCHGGGFVSQSPDSHEIYLRDWAKETDVPILSIDYSLAPEAPFPQPLDEITLVYAWALNHLSLLGTTGEEICVAGDSAGGNLSLGLVLRCIDLGIRIPDGAVILYAPLLLDMVPSPSRLMACMDPLIPLGFMLTCLDAYAGINKIDQDEYGNESPCKEERIRKTSSICEYLDSGMNIIREIEKMELEDDHPNSEESFVVISQNPISLSSENGDDRRDILTDEDEPMAQSPSPPNEAASPHDLDDYVEAFLKKYNPPDEKVLESLPKGKGRSFYFNDQISLYDLPSDLMYSWHRKCCQWSRVCINKVSHLVSESTLYNRRLPWLNPSLPSSSETQIRRWSKDPAPQQALSNKFKKMKILSRNPFMSPYCATDEQLKHFPPLYLLSLHFDPCLDDSVMLARRLKKLGKPVQLKIVDKLPHGFLNFAFFIKEAHDASKICIDMLKSALGILKKLAR